MHDLISILLTCFLLAIAWASVFRKAQFDFLVLYYRNRFTDWESWLDRGRMLMLRAGQVILKIRLWLAQREQARCDKKLADARRKPYETKNNRRG